ncbi:MAG: hypothetical protein ACI4NG_06205, partial [Candidatus Gallimonas sp.]
ATERGMPALSVTERGTSILNRDGATGTSIPKRDRATGMPIPNRDEATGTSILNRDEAGLSHPEISPKFIFGDFCLTKFFMNDKIVYR